MSAFEQGTSYALGTILGALATPAVVGAAFGWGARRRTRVQPTTGLPPPGVGTYDVRDEARAYRRAGRLLRLAQGAAAATAIVSIVATIVMGDVRWLAVGVALVGAGVVATRWSRRALVPHAGSLRRTSVLGLAVGTAGLGLGAVAVAALATAALASDDPGPLRAEDGTVLAQGATLKQGLLVAGLVAAVLAVAASRVARRIDQRSVASVLHADGRLPIVYLRSFGDDDVRLVRGASVRRPAIDLLGIRPSERFEEVLAALIATHGPPIAFSDPRSARRIAGVPRHAVSSDLDEQQRPEWQRLVTSWMDHAAATVLVAGATPGLAWEIATALARCPHKVRIVLPPDTPDGTARRVEVLRAAAAEAGVHVPSYGSSDAAVGIVRNASVEWLRVDRRDESAYAAALDVAEALTVGRAADRPATRTSNVSSMVTIGVATALALFAGSRLDPAFAATGTVLGSLVAESDAAPTAPIDAARADPATCSVPEIARLTFDDFVTRVTARNPALAGRFELDDSACVAGFLVLSISDSRAHDRASFLYTADATGLYLHHVARRLDLEALVSPGVAATLRAQGW